MDLSLVTLQFLLLLPHISPNPASVGDHLLPGGFSSVALQRGLPVFLASLVFLFRKGYSVVLSLGGMMVLILYEAS